MLFTGRECDQFQAKTLYNGAKVILLLFTGRECDQFRAKTLYNGAKVILLLFTGRECDQFRAKTLYNGAKVILLSLQVGSVVSSGLRPCIMVLRLFCCRCRSGVWSVPG